ncbi:peroxide stress protein YaaA [Rhodobaculum claviforme]|uniref:UPF0246 protein CCR87_02400 n=1 Tax=Rhodobaculum claviforme TaxID=1549854 RepID=A0A934TID2_9RHOB|nr:peroxide stress protein YaaA [Rhodobaculum claviforme]MBK5926213.1 hypothetical protein [Rhodobaculum claviforme]
MIVVISPAKRLDWSEVPGTPTAPEFGAQARELADLARGLSADDLARMMKLSPQLARLNAERFRDFAADPDPAAVRPAAFAFAGDTYAGLEARSLSDDALRWAEGHLRILSGLYGVLRPMDAIQPYRLEMGTRMETPAGRDLYAFWGDRIARALNAAGAAAGSDWLVNCASQEYFGAVDSDALRLRVITPVFLEDRPGGPKIVSFYAKKARGAMARFVMEHRIDTPAALTAFDTGGYAHAPDLSEPDRPAFLRAG